MQVNFWGARGSVPVSGPDYVRYGGDTTCLEILSANQTRLIIDAGTGLRSLVKNKQEKSLADFHWLFTHFHWDHVLGFPFYLPLLTQRHDIHLHCLNPIQAGIYQHLTGVMAPPFFPLSFDLFSDHITFCEHELTEFWIDSLQIASIPLSHPNVGLGYKLIEQGKSFVFMTDNELGYRHPGGRDYADYVAFCAEADLLVHDAEFTSPEYRRTRTWGHSTVEQALQLACDAGVKALGLFHHNRDRSDEDIEALVRGCLSRLQARNMDIACLAVAQGAEYLL